MPIAMHGEPEWGPNFTNPTYANPAAPKGGQLVQGVLGTFDCLNPFIVKGHARGQYARLRHREPARARL